MSKEYADILHTILNTHTKIAYPVSIKVFEQGVLQKYSIGEIIFPENKYNAFEYFQLDGISHRFNLDEAENAVTTGIYNGAIVITPNFARNRNNQSIFTLQSLTETNFLKIPVGAFDDLRNTIEELRAFGQRVVEHEFIRSLNFEVLFRSHSAKERLIFFRSNYRNLENLIPHTVIASFLGITPVSFSRLRKELAR